MSHQPLLVDRCACLNVTFERMKRLHDKEGLDFDGLRQRTGCCTNCSRCEPYIRLMLDTGEVRFPVLDKGASDRVRSGTRP